MKIKTPKIKQSTPTEIKALIAKLRLLEESASRMSVILGRVIGQHDNIDKVLEKAYYDGMPGDMSAITGEVHLLKEETQYLRQLADGFDSYANSLLAKSPKEW